MLCRKKTSVHYYSAVHLVFMTQSITITLQCTELQAMRAQLDACSDYLYLGALLQTLQCTKIFQLGAPTIYYSVHQAQINRVRFGLTPLIAVWSPP